MKIRYFPIVAAAVIMPLHVVGAQDVATLKAEADLEKVRADTAKVYSDLMSGLRTAQGGSATMTAPEASAEGALLAHHAYSGAAARLAKATAQWDGGATNRPIVIIGSTPPSVSQWLAIQQAGQRLADNLTRANGNWDETAEPEPRRSRWGAGSIQPYMSTESVGAMAAAGPVGAVLGAVTSIASLFRVDTSVAGAALSADDAQLDALLLRALAEQGFAVEAPHLRLVADHRRVEAILAGLEKPYAEARRRYDAEYLPMLKAAGAADKLNPAVKEAAIGLATVIADHDALRKALYTPVSGVLPIAVIERQAALQENLASRRVIYIRGRRAALSTVTRKNFFTGYGDVPAHFAALAIIDYALVDPSSDSTVVASGSVSCAIPKVRLVDVFATTRTRPAPRQWVGRLPDDEARAARMNTADGICEGEPVQGWRPRPGADVVGLERGEVDRGVAVE